MWNYQFLAFGQRIHVQQTKIHQKWLFILVLQNDVGQWYIIT